MSEYITQIPNLEKGKVYTINVSDAESAVNVVQELVHRLCVTYNTAVGYISLNDHIDAVREQSSDWKSAAVLNCIKQNNPDCGTIIRKMEGLYNRRFVRTFISDRLKVPRAYSKLKESPSNEAIRLDCFASKKKVPVIAIVFSTVVFNCFLPYEHRGYIGATL